jgi:uncharacterized repeat protein (TIGR03843 family)
VPRDERASDPADLIVREVPSALATGDMHLLGFLPGSSNAALLARCGSGADAVLAVYKPQRGESPLWDFPDGTLHRREVAAYEVARALGFPNVPPTVLRDGPEGPGSVQTFIRSDPAQHYFTLDAERADDFRLVAVFDLLVNNADRKAGHCLLDAEGTIWVIDHGVCFAVEPKLRTVIWDFIGDAFPEDAVRSLARVRADLDGGGPLRRTLEQLLDRDEVDATTARTHALLASGIFPEPDPDVRPFPWPPI